MAVVQLTTDLVVRLLTLNIFLRPFLISSYWNGEYKEERMEMFVEEYSKEYDVISMQEVFGSWSWRRERLIEMFYERGFTHFAHMSDAPREHFHCSKFGCLKGEAPYLSTDSGILIVSRYPIHSTHEMIFSRKQWSDSMARKGVLHVRLNVTESVQIDVFTTHLQSGSKPSSEEIRDAQLQEMSQFIAEHASSESTVTVVNGDFNMNGMDEDEYERLLRGLTSRMAKATLYNVIEEMTAPTSYGHSNIFELKRSDSSEYIDYMFLFNPRRCTVETAGVRPFPVTGEKFVRLSDHDGVECTLKITV